MIRKIVQNLPFCIRKPLAVAFMFMVIVLGTALLVWKEDTRDTLICWIDDFGDLLNYRKGA